MTAIDAAITKVEILLAFVVIAEKEKLLLHFTELAKFAVSAAMRGSSK